MQKIVPNIWFDSQAEDAAKFYTELFPNSSVDYLTHYTEAGQEIHGQAPGSVMTAEFTVAGFRFTAINGGPVFKPNPSISFMVNLTSKDDVNRIWGVLLDGGKVLMPLQKYPFSELYGWVEDRFGISWQLIFATEEVKQMIVPSLLFMGENVGKAEEAMHFYTSVFDGAVKDIFRYGADQAPDKEGTIGYGGFELAGVELAAMDSAQQHEFDFNEGISLLVNCDDQVEIDKYWEKLSAVPEAEQCGWIKDKYGVSWQIAPAMLDDLLKDEDSEKSKRAMEAMMKMKKLDIDELQRAYNGE